MGELDEQTGHEKTIGILNDHLASLAGEGTVAEADSVVNSLDSSVRRHLLAASEKGDAERQRAMEAWKQFIDGLFARAESANAVDPELVITALGAASAILDVEPSAKSHEAAVEAAKAFERRGYRLQA